jgi:hypothetical protein
LSASNADDNLSIERLSTDAMTMMMFVYMIKGSLALVRQECSEMEKHHSSSQSMLNKHPLLLDAFPTEKQPTISALYRTYQSAHTHTHDDGKQLAERKNER